MIDREPFSQSEPAPLEGFERRTVTISALDLERALTRAVKAGVRDVLSEVMSEAREKQFWRRGFDELHAHSAAKVRDGVGGWTIKWISGVLVAVAIAIYFKFGPIK